MESSHWEALAEASSSYSAANAPAKREGQTLLYDPPDFEVVMRDNLVDLPQQWVPIFPIDISSLNIQMKLVYETLKTWIRNVQGNNPYSSSTIRASYQIACARYHEMVHAIRSDNLTGEFDMLRLQQDVLNSSLLLMKTTLLQRALSLQAEALQAMPLVAAQDPSPEDLDSHVKARLSEFLITMPSSSARENSPVQSGDVSLSSLPSQPLHQERSALSLVHFNPPRLKKPPRFNGDRTKFREWWSRVTAYLEYYGDEFPSSDQYKINWLGSYLQGIAQSWHLVRDTQMKREGVLDTWAAYSTEFQEDFKDEAEERRNAVKAYKKAVRASKIAAESSKNAAQECEKFKRMMELEWQGDTELYLSELRELNDSMHWSGVVLRKHVFKSIPNMMIEWVYTRNWPLPESDDEFLNAVSGVGQSYENWLAVCASIAEHSEPDQPKVKEPERQRLRSSNPVSRTKESRKSGRVKISTPAEAEEAPQGIDPSANVDCWRCGRESRDSHKMKTSTSYARKDVNGRELPPSLKRRREVEEEEHERDCYKRWKRSTPCVRDPQS
ncbi:hypothetical protein E4U19_003902 [Claviceps sp. Clav32 group G5]|nr:hypothetical protein E4U19_003902 [Claviceps sp. Clav32 group G5]KAG6046068.1 hypothetical protein E4U39_001669 [Claviceps sp. Clav50 group G5]